MSVESTTTKVIYVGNGVATEWPVPFKYNKPEHLHLLVTDASGAHELVTSNFQVQVTEAGDTSILYPVSGQPLATGKRLTIYRATPQTQIVDLIYGGAFAPEVLEEDGLDREVMMIQELQEGLDRAVKVGIDSDETPEELLENIFTARDEAVDSATSAAANANAAGNSAQAAAGSAAIATEEREAACICAGEARDARDVAIAQAEAANTLMEAELSKVNAIVAANKTDQQAAVTAARQWAEKAPDTPVDYDEEGNPRYSARHWAENAQKIAIEPPTPERRGAVRVGDGLTLATGENGETDLLAVSPDLGARLQLNNETWLTESGTFIAPVAGWYEALLFAGGEGGEFIYSNTAWAYGNGGRSGGIKSGLVYLEEGQEVPFTIGAGGPGRTNITVNHSGGVTTFGELTTLGAPRLFGQTLVTSVPSKVNMAVSGGGLGAGHGAGGIAVNYLGGGGGALWVGSTSAKTAMSGAQGSARLRYYDPAKAAGPLTEPALFAARRMTASRAASAPGTVNLYDPETGQGSVWRAEDAEAKLAEGLISEEAWLAICAAKAAEEYAEWLTSPDTLAERFALLRAARDAKLAEHDVQVVQLQRQARAGADVSDDLAAWDAYAVALCDLPAQAGAPWDGGGELTPWPDAPTVKKVESAPEMEAVPEAQEPPAVAEVPGEVAVEAPESPEEA